MGALAFGAAILTNTGNLQNIMNAFTAPVVGGVDVAAAAAGLAGVLTFDKDYGKRCTNLPDSQCRYGRIPVLCT